MALYGDLTYDSRVRREAATLARAGYDVTVACLAAEGRQSDLPRELHVVTLRPATASVLPGSPNPFFAPSQGRLASIKSRVDWLWGYISGLRSWGRLATAACSAADLWHVHDLTGLVAIGSFADSATPMIYDAHELFLETGTALRMPRPARSLLRAYERRLVSRVSAVVTVNDHLADVLRRRYRPRRIEVLHNCPDRWWPSARRGTLIRDEAAIPGDVPVILHHGTLSSNRGIEQLMDALLVPGLEDAHLALLGPGEQRGKYVEAARDPRWRGRVHVLDPVPPADLLAWVASADVGAMPIQASTLNHYLSTPNKLFECLAAGIPVVASDFPAMRRIVLDNPAGPLGAVCDPARVEDVAAALRSILDMDRGATKSIRARCAAAARDRWNWDVESARLTALYGELLPLPL